MMDQKVLRAVKMFSRTLIDQGAQAIVLFGSWEGGGRGVGRAGRILTREQACVLTRTVVPLPSESTYIKQ